MSQINTELDLQNPTIWAALEASIAAYDEYGVNKSVLTLSGGWTQIFVSPPDSQNVKADSYQGVAFYRVVNGETEVIIGNRGSKSFHDFTVSDALLAINATPPADTDALNYYNAVVEWLRTNSSKLAGSVQIIETGHSLGGQEADYVLAYLADGNQEAVYSTSAITFDAPGLSTSMVKVGADYNALNISLDSEAVHIGGSLMNAGYLGSSITIGGGINPIVAGIAIGFVANPVLGLLAALGSAFGFNHVTGRLTNYFADSPALGGVNLSTYSPTQVTQTAANALSDITASKYNSMSANDLVTLYQSLLKNSTSGSGSNNSSLKELFTVETTSTGCVLQGTGNDTITMTFSGNQEIVKDNHGNQMVLTFNSLGTELITATYSVGDPTTGTINFSPDGSSTQTMTYNSGAYATITNDGFGDVTTDYFSKSGVHYASDWIHSDGTSGTYEVVPNGVVGVSGTTVSDMPSTTQVVNPDGSYFVITRDASDRTITYNYKADGSFASQTTFLGTQSDYDQSAVANTTTSSNGLTTFFDSHGNKLHDTWTAADGTTGTDTFHASGMIEGTKQNTDGSSDTYTVYGASGTPNTQTFIASPVATYTFLRGDDFTRTHFNADGSIASDTWQLNDGASGQDNFTNGAGSGTITHADGSKSTLTVNATGNILVDNLDTAGQKASEDEWNAADGTHSVTVFDAGGLASEKFTYLTNGKVASTVYAADGTVAQTSTLAAGQVLNPDGSRFVSTTDPNGGYDIDYWDANGDVTIFKYSAGVLQNIDHVSATDLGAQMPPHNAYTSQYTQDDGMNVTVFLDAGGHSTGSDWTKPDGSHGADILNADGSKTGVKTLADGSSTTYEEDAAGNLTNESYDANGFQTSDLWRNVDGTHGYDLFNADGSTSGNSYAADGSYNAYNDDGSGNTQSADYDAAGKQLDDQWQKSDGTAGSDIHNADGSSSGSVSYADSASATYTNDGKGDTKQTYFDAQGTKTDDVWAKADGSHGWDNFFSTGASSGTTVNANGSYSTYTNDGQGHIATADYDAQGHLVTSHGGGGSTTTTPLPGGGTETTTVDTDGTSVIVISNADGTSSDTTNHTDGSYTVSSTNALGEIVTSAYDWQGNLTGTAITESSGAGNTITTWRDATGAKIAETFTRADGTSGVDHVSALDYIGEQNLAPPLAGSDIYYAHWGLPSWDNPTVAWSRITATSGGVDAEFQLMPGWDPSVPSAQYGYNTLELSEGDGSLYRGVFEIYDPATGVDFFGTQNFDGSKTLDGDSPTRNVWTLTAPTSSTPLTGTVAGYNGTTSTFGDDGQGNGELVSFDASGRKIDDIWWHNDGSMGADRFLADGTSTGVSAGPDAKVTTYTADAQGHITSSNTSNGTSGIQLAPPAPPVVHVTLPTISGSTLPSNGSGWTVPDLTHSDGNGGTYTVHFSAADGSAHAVHTDASGHVINNATVDTDPGYAASALVDGVTYRWGYDAQGQLTTRVHDDGAGTVTTESIDAAGGVARRAVEVFDSQGNVAASIYDAAGQLTGTSITTSSSSNGVTTKTTTLLDAAGNAAGSTVVVDDGQGNTVTTHYDASGTVQSSSEVTVTAADAVISTDYDASGHAIDAFTSNVNASGVVQTSMYDAAGDLTGTVVATPDANGGITTTNYDANGNLTSYVVLTQDSQGNSVFEGYDAQGHHLREDIIASTGVETSTMFHADGSWQSTKTATDGSYDVTAVDTQGDSVTTQYTARNFKLSDTWTRPDGSSGSDTFNADGTTTGTATYADGTQATIAIAADGDVTTTHYSSNGIETGKTVTHSEAARTTVTTFDINGVKLGDRWVSLDGNTGTDTYKAGGAYSSSITHTDGTRDTVSGDTQGDVVTRHFDSTGTLVSSTSTTSDGTLKTTTFNADGTYSWIEKDAQGTLLADDATYADGSEWGQTYAADGFVTGDNWKNPNGVYGWDTFERDGTGTSTSVGTDGIRYDYVNGINSDTWTGSDGTHGTDAWNWDDYWGTSTSFNADGSSWRQDWSHEGNFKIDYADSGKPVDETWGRADGSYGSTTFNADGTISGSRTDGQGVVTNFDHAAEALTVAASVQNQSVGSGVMWTFQLPAGTFQDANAGDFLQYSATLANGDALPSWLTFNTHTHTFSGTAPDGADLALKVTATDLAGLQAASTFVISSDGSDHAPVAGQVGNQSVVEGAVWNFVMPSSTFTDVDAGDTLAYTASLANGAALPSWITFDASTGTFSGTPPSGSAGTFDLQVRATDAQGASVNANFELDVTQLNQPPVVNAPMPDQAGAETRAFSVQLPSDLFSDANPNATLTWSVQQTSGQALPSWLAFDASTHTLSGTPAIGDGGALTLRVSVADATGATASEDFHFVIDRAPQVAQPIENQSASESHAWTFTLPTGTFIDTDPGDTLTYAATLTGGAALPSWLAFDASKGTFSGTPPQGSAGSMNLQVTATDAAGLVASAAFAFSVLHADQPPVVAQPIPAQNAMEGTGWTFTVPAGAFTDPDAGDQLTYSANLLTGLALPSWLSFDPATRTFSGTPPLGTAGVWAPEVFVTDTSGASAHAVFGLFIGETLTGTSANDTLTGSDCNDVLKGFGGNDSLDGSFGADTMAGGAGNDTYAVDNIGDVVIEAAGQGTDTVLSSISYALAPNVENLTLTGRADLTATGNDLANTITANSGNDTLIAGAGIARLIGGSGNDTFVVNNTADTVRAQAGGDNSVLTSVSYAAPANVHNLTGTGSADIVLTGGTQPIVITGNAGNDTLKAGSGVATLVGGSGNTTFVVNNVADVVIEHAGSGLAVVQSSVNYTAPDNVQSLFLTGGAPLTATGNAHGGANLIVGNSGADTLIGGTGIDVLEAGSGKTTLVASASAVMLGGANADTITAGAGAVFIDPGAGPDVVTLGGADSVIAFNKGDGNDILISGNAAGNTLSLGGGISEGDLSFSKSGNNLVLKVAGSDSIVLQNWYATGAAQDVSTLQIIEQASADYNASSSNVLVNSGVQEFDFARLVSMFDQARALNSSLSSWKLSNGLVDAHLSGSDTSAFGGDLAYWDGMRGNLKNMNLTAAVATVSDPDFGHAVQIVGSWTLISHGDNPLA